MRNRETIMRKKRTIRPMMKIKARKILINNHNKIENILNKYLHLLQITDKTGEWDRI
jgi:hypothetical protein